MGFIFRSFILLMFVGTINSEQSQFCSDSDNCDNAHSKNKYTVKSDRWEQYNLKVEEASANYVPCGENHCHDSVIDKDLAVFGGKISREQVDKAAEISRVTKYQVIDHKLYRSEDCMFHFRCRGIEHFLLGLVDQLPNTEMIVNTRDWPQVNKHFSTPLPVFSFSKTGQYYDIMYPAWTFWEGGPATSLYPTGLGRWDLHRDSLAKASSDWPWSKKENKAFFRGSRTSSERDPLVLLSRRRPELVDAAYTRNQAWKSDKDTLGAPPAEEVALKDHCRYKYLFNYRGVAASFRLKHLFLCRSLVFHVGDEWLEFFYEALRPWVHYIPVDSDSDMGQLEELIEFALHHNDLAEKIAENGRKFIEDNLRMKDVSDYWAKLVTEYTGLLDYEVKKDENLVLVKN